MARAAMPLDVRLMNWVASGLLAGFVALGLGSAALWAVRHSGWQLGGIVVDGDVAHQNAVTFRANLASRLTGSYPTMDLKEVKRLFETMPWVRQAVVRREFPNRLHITLKEHEPVAWWGESGDGKMVDAQGEVFEANADDSQSDSWPELVGPEGQSAHVYGLYQDLVSVFEPLDWDIQRLELGSSGSWRVTLDNDAVIELGRGQPEEVVARTRAFTTTITQLMARYGGRHLESADLRYPNGYAVRLQGVTTVLDDKAAKAALKR